MFGCYKRGMTLNTEAREKTKCDSLLIGTIGTRTLTLLRPMESHLPRKTVVSIKLTRPLWPQGHKGANREGFSLLPQRSLGLHLGWFMEQTLWSDRRYLGVHFQLTVIPVSCHLFLFILIFFLLFLHLSFFHCFFFFFLFLTSDCDCYS